MRPIKRILGILTGLSLLQARVEAAVPAPVRLEDLLEGFRRMPGLEARFREEKQIALLSEPLVSEGTFHYAPPARLARHTLTPAKSSLVIDGLTLSFGNGQTHEEIDVGANPVLREYVDSFLLVLKGDHHALLEAWRIEVSGQIEKWEMTLRPDSEAIGKTVKEVILRGSGAVIHWARIVETTDDVTVTTFSEVNSGRRYNQAEIDRLFRVPNR